MIKYAACPSNTCVSSYEKNSDLRRDADFLVSKCASLTTALVGKGLIFPAALAQNPFTMGLDFSVHRVRSEVQVTRPSDCSSLNAGLGKQGRIFQGCKNAS